MPIVRPDAVILAVDEPSTASIQVRLPHEPENSCTDCLLDEATELMVGFAVCATKLYQTSLSAPAPHPGRPVPAV